MIGVKITNKEFDFDWQDVDEAELKLGSLRDRDLQVAAIAKGLNMRSRITQLEEEIAQLRSMEKAWITNRTGRLYFSIPRAFLKIFRKFTGS